MFRQFSFVFLLFCCFSLLILLIDTPRMLQFARQRFSRSSALPPGPLPLPIVGNNLLLTGNVVGKFQKLHAKYGPIVYSNHMMMGVPAFIISDPNVIEMADRNDVFLSRGSGADAGLEKMKMKGKGLVLNNDQLIRERSRKMLIKAVTNSKFKEMVFQHLLDTFNLSYDGQLEHAAHYHSVFSFKEYAESIICEVVCFALFSEEVKHSQVPLQELVDQYTLASKFFLFMPKPLWTVLWYFTRNHEKNLKRFWDWEKSMPERNIEAFSNDRAERIHQKF